MQEKLENFIPVFSLLRFFSPKFIWPTCANLALYPFPSPILTSSLSTYAKATFLENAFPRKKSRRSRKPIFTVWFFYTLEVWRNFAQGFPFFPQRTIVWNHFWKSILIYEITCIHDITSYENGGSIYESFGKKPTSILIKFHLYADSPVTGSSIVDVVHCPNRDSSTQDS